MKLELGKTVYHKDIYWGQEQMTIVGIRANEVELQGDYSGGTHNVCQRGWEPIEGLLEEKPNYNIHYDGSSEGMSGN